MASAYPAGVSVVGRRENVYASTFPSEIITCRAADGSLLELLCKCVDGPPEHIDLPPSRPSYETDVYRHVITPLPITAPRYYGAWSNAALGDTWLVIEWLSDARRVSHVEDPLTSIVVAATWIGAFHALNESRVTRLELSFLRRYDTGHFRTRLERAFTATKDLVPDYRWLPQVLGQFDTITQILLGAQQTIIHGEYYPDNILYRGGSVYPVDWETAAVAPGEIDLAMLTENWPSDVVERCTCAYLQARYASISPDPGFGSRLAAARAYVQIHWLGYESDPSRPDWTLRTRGAWRCDQLYEAGRRLGLV
jgi:hypothetical protein